MSSSTNTVDADAESGSWDCAGYNPFSRPRNVRDTVDSRVRTSLNLYIDTIYDSYKRTHGEIKKVGFYDVSTQSDYDGFNPHLLHVCRRYSEFQTFRKVLVAKGATPLRLSWTRWIPGYVSRWEELNDWAKHLGKLRFNEDCLIELKRFLEDESPYQAEKTSSGLWLIDRLFNLV